jgi:predicted regulator of Ras-like GTPase activity (Roadblock/LC7/MglB family)
MPYRSVLERLVRAVPGVQAALMLDSEGEVVVETGPREDRLRLIGAYQGIALATARRTASRYAGGPITYMLSRYAWGQVILRPLKDGYYMILSLAPDAAAGPGLHHSELAQAHLDQEL